MSNNLGMRAGWTIFVASAASILASSGCALDFSTPNGTVSVINSTGRTLRLTGNCVPDDAQTLSPGASDSDIYPGSECRVDDGDGLHGVLGCLQVGSRGQTVLTEKALRRIVGPNDCWQAGSR